MSFILRKSINLKSWSFSKSLILLRTLVSNARDVILYGSLISNFILKPTCREFCRHSLFRKRVDVSSRRYFDSLLLGGRWSVLDLSSLIQISPFWLVFFFNKHTGDSVSYLLLLYISFGCLQISWHNHLRDGRTWVSLSDTSPTLFQTLRGQKRLVLFPICERIKMDERIERW